MKLFKSDHQKRGDWEDETLLHSCAFRHIQNSDLDDPYVISDKGKKWRQTKLPFAYSVPLMQLGMAPSAVRFQNDRIGTVVIYQPKPQQHISVLQTKDGGQSWIDEPVDTPKDMAVSKVFLSQNREFLTLSDTINNKIALFKYK